MELLRRRIFLAKAERIDVAQLELEFAETKAKLEKLAKELGPEAACETSPPGSAGTPAEPRKPKGRRDLTTLDIPEERVEILDPTLEGNAERIGFEESYRLGYRRATPVRIVVARATYKVSDEQ